MYELDLLTCTIRLIKMLILTTLGPKTFNNASVKCF